MDQVERNARRKPNDESGVVADVAAGAPNIVQTADIFKLDIDCFEETFDFLPIKDLVSVGKTCKRLQQVAGYCFRNNYSGRAVCWSSDGFVYNIDDAHDVNHFAPFIQRIDIEFLEGLKFFLNVQSKYRSLKQIGLHSMPIPANDVNRLNETLARVEVLQLEGLELNGSRQHIIDQCTKLKRLGITWCKGDYSWLDRKYPLLEYFKLGGYNSVDGLAMFLERNPNIRKFATDSECLLKNRDALMAANIKLDELAILLSWTDYDEFVSLCRLLNELHERGFYKRLQLYLDELPNHETIIDPATANGLVKCCVTVSFDTSTIALWAVESLEEIAVDRSACISDWGVLVDKLTNLKRIHLREATIDDIMPFIRRSLELRKIRIDFIRDGMHFSEETLIIDLKALKKEREQLPDAEKITLYVEEKIYLATKWAMKETDFGLIQIKRLASFEWDHDFYF